MPTRDNDPAVGDPVVIRGRITAIIDGTALVTVYRSYPPGGTVSVQCGALELDEAPEDDGAVPESEEDRIRALMAEAQEHPGRIVTR